MSREWHEAVGVHLILSYHVQHVFILSSARTYININLEISKYFGTDSTGGGIGFQFRAIKANAGLQKKCIASGGDPKDLNIGMAKSQKPSLCFVLEYIHTHVHRFGHRFGVQQLTSITEISKYYPEASPYALQHHFRAILKEAKQLRANGGRTSHPSVFAF